MLDFRKLNAMADFVLRYQGGPGAKKPNVQTIFTDRFIGKVTLSDAEWDQADKETVWVAQKLGKRV